MSQTIRYCKKGMQSSSLVSDQVKEFWCSVQIKARMILIRLPHARHLAWLAFTYLDMHGIVFDSSLSILTFFKSPVHLIANKSFHMNFLCTDYASSLLFANCRVKIAFFHMMRKNFIASSTSFHFLHMLISFIDMLKDLR